MIIAIIEHIESAENMLKSAYYLSSKLTKDFGVASFVSDIQEFESVQSQIKSMLNKLELPSENIYVLSQQDATLVDFCEKEEVSFLLLQLESFSRKFIQKRLNDCRELRIPYLFFKREMEVFNFNKVLLPVGFLVEEYEKAQFASAFGRFCNAEIVILQANDYGTKAAITVDKMCTLFDKFTLKYSVEKGKKDSFKLDNEAMIKAHNESFDVLIISASREYGLDDVIFGSKELHIIKKSETPVLIVNPREDLYTLCD